MQLKLQRSQREGGVMAKSVIFCLDARVAFTPEETANIRRYKLQKQVIYNSEASKRALDRGSSATDGSTVGHLKSLAFTALAAMNLNISIESLERGQHIECKSLDELLGAEQAVISACENLKGYLETAATFDGREVLIDFNSEKPEIVATSTAPAPMLVAPETPTKPIPHQQVSEKIAAAPVMRDTEFNDNDLEPVVPNAIAAMFNGVATMWDRDPAKVILWGGGAIFLIIVLTSLM